MIKATTDNLFDVQNIQKNNNNFINYLFKLKIFFGHAATVAYLYILLSFHLFFSHFFNLKNVFDVVLTYKDFKFFDKNQKSSLSDFYSIKFLTPTCVSRKYSYM